MCKEKEDSKRTKSVPNAPKYVKCESGVVCEGPTGEVSRMLLS